MKNGLRIIFLKKRSFSEDKDKAKKFKNVPYAKTLAKKIFDKNKEKYYGFKIEVIRPMSD